MGSSTIIHGNTNQKLEKESKKMNDLNNSLEVIKEKQYKSSQKKILRKK